MYPDIHIDTKKEKPLEITGVLNRCAIRASKIFKKAKISIGSQNIKSSYLIFHLENISVKENISYEKILIILYLHELGLFTLGINISGRNFYLKDIMNLGYIVQDYTHKGNKLFKLTQIGIDVVNDFNKRLKDNSSLIAKNRETDVDLDSQVKSALDSYYNN